MVVWYRIPESRRASGGVRLSTVVTVGSDQLRWVPAGSRVRMRVQNRDRLSICLSAHELFARLDRGLAR